MLSLQLALKCADLGHTTANLPVHLRWVSGLEEEVCARSSSLTMTILQNICVYLSAAPVLTSWLVLPVCAAQFFRQGDQEAQTGLPISPLFDRAKQGITKSQVGFFDIVGRKLISAVKL